MTAIDEMLERTQGNQLRAAAMLGINRNTLRLKRRMAGANESGSGNQD